MTCPLASELWAMNWQSTMVSANLRKRGTVSKRDPHERRVQVLHAVVERYLATRQPVGSAAVCKKLTVKASPATVRNDMAELEEAGYLAQPHTSAGRIPTVRAYRLLVDRVVSLMPLSAPQRAAISAFLDDQPSMEDTLRMAARLLARITGQIAVVSSPSFTHATLRRFEIVPLSASVFLLIVISSTGRVEQRTIISADPPADEEIRLFSERVNSQGAGRPVSLLSSLCTQIARSEASHPFAAYARSVAAALSGLDDSVRSDSLYMAGTAHLTQSSAISREELSNLLDALEEQVVMMRLLSTVSRSGSRTGVGVAIGAETHLRSLLHSSVVSSAYLAAPEQGRHGQQVRSPIAQNRSHQPSSSSPNTTKTAEYTKGEVSTTNSTKSGDNAEHEEGEEAYVGSIGPTHIDYPSTMADVKAVATYLSTIISRQEA